MTRAARALQRRAGRAGAAARASRRPTPRARGRAAQAQPAARAAAAAARRVGRPARGVRGDVPRQRVRDASSRVAYGAGPARRSPGAGAVRDLLPLADRPVDPRPRAARGGRADADLLRAAHARAAVRAATTRRPRRRRSTPRCARSTACSPSRSRTACGVAPAGEPCLEARTPLELEAELGMPGGNIFHRDLAWPFAEDEAEVGRVGRRDRARQRAAVRRGRAARRRRQRHPRPQRRDGASSVRRMRTAHDESDVDVKI